MNEIKNVIVFVGGIYNLAFGIFHIMFWKKFRWKEQLKKLNIVNSGIMQVLNLCLIFIFFMMAYISIFNTNDLLTTGIGKTILVSFAIFWFLRSIYQIVFFGLNAKISTVLFILFVLGAIIYTFPILFQ